MPHIVLKCSDGCLSYGIWKPGGSGEETLVGDTDTAGDTTMEFRSRPSWMSASSAAGLTPCFRIAAPSQRRLFRSFVLDFTPTSCSTGAASPKLAVSRPRALRSLPPHISMSLGVPGGVKTVARLRQRYQVRHHRRTRCRQRCFVT